MLKANDAYKIQMIWGRTCKYRIGSLDILTIYVWIEKQGTAQPLLQWKQAD